MDNDPVAFEATKNSIGLLVQRDANGAPRKDTEGKLMLIDAVAAKALLGKTQSTANMGMGDFGIYVPKADIEKLGLSRIWDAVGFPVGQKSGYYFVADNVLGNAIVDVLSAQAGCSWKDAQALYAASQPKQDGRGR